LTRIRGFDAALIDLQNRFSRQTHDIRSFDDAEPFSRHAYNSLAKTILGTLIDAIADISNLIGPKNYSSNLGIIAYSSLIKGTCGHFFSEYERLHNFHDPREGKGKSLVTRSGFKTPLFERMLNKAVLSTASNIHRKNPIRVGWIGSASVPWGLLAYHLIPYNISLSKYLGHTREPLLVQDQQISLINEWASMLWKTMSSTIDRGQKNVAHLNVNALLSDSIQTYSRQNRSSFHPDLLISGTLGKLHTRINILCAQSAGIPIATFHHGAHYNIFDEPLHILHENMLPDFRIVYGSMHNAQKNSAESINLSGAPIKYASRTDTFVNKYYGGGEVETVRSLRGLRGIYLSAGGGWQWARWGPFRDVHPATYLGWQEKLLDWLRKVTGKEPLFRPHPKRGNTRYDPEGVQMIESDMRSVMEAADFFVIDFPTTSLAYICASDKPVLFFDVQLRRVHSDALAAIRGRCHYAETDMLHADPAFDLMNEQLQKEFSHTFVPYYCLADDGGKNEIQQSAEIIKVLVS